MLRMCCGGMEKETKKEERGNESDKSKGAVLLQREALQQHCFCGGFEMMEETFERSKEFDLWCFDLATMEMNYIVIQICFH